MESLNGFEQKAWNFSFGFPRPRYRPCRQKGKNKKAILPENKYTGNHMVLKDALQYSACTIEHTGKSPKTLRKERRDAGVRQVTCLSFQPALHCIHLGMYSFPSITSVSWKHRQVCSGQPQNDDWQLGLRTRPNTCGSIAPSRDAKVSEILSGLLHLYGKAEPWLNEIPREPSLIWKMRFL